jgi:hypothetical protein
MLFHDPAAANPTTGHHRVRKQLLVNVAFATFSIDSM